MNVSVVVNGSCAGDILRNSYPPAGGPASVGISSYPYGIEAALTDLWISGATAVFHRNDNHQVLVSHYNSALILGCRCCSIIRISAYLMTPKVFVPVVIMPGQRIVNGQ